MRPDRDGVNNYSIRFEISNNSSTIRFDSFRNEKNTIRTALADWNLKLSMYVKHDVHSYS